MSENYFLEWIKSFTLFICIEYKIFCIWLLFFGFTINLNEKRYAVTIWFPKYGLSLTNEKKYPYVEENYFYKKGHFYVTHCIGKKITPKNGY